MCWIGGTTAFKFFNSDVERSALNVERDTDSLATDHSILYLGAGAMRILLLGTAAAEGYPGIFCECKNCLQARAAWRGIRLRSSALLNNDPADYRGRIYLPPLSVIASSLASLNTILVTHFHEDHWLPANLLLRHKVGSAQQELPTLHIYGGSRLKEEMEILCRNHNQTMEGFEIQAHVVEPFEGFSAGPIKWPFPPYILRTHLRSFMRLPKMAGLLLCNRYGAFDRGSVGGIKRISRGFNSYGNDDGDRLGGYPFG